MRVLVVGGGGREHALVETLAQSPMAEEIFAAPGNPGMGGIAELVDIPADDLIALRNFAKVAGIDLTVVGPEAPLVGGIAEAFWEEGLKIFGPSRAAARIEGSKVFAKEIMRHAGVPAAHSEAFDRQAAALAYLRSLPPDGYPVVVKVDGLAAGKGVIVAGSYEEAQGAVYAAFAGAFGAAGERLIVEEYLTGREASVFALTDGRNILPFVPAQDYKRIYDGDEGLNTGGMGAYSPVPVIPLDTAREAVETILKPAVAAIRDLGIPYKGVLYAGIIVTERGLKTLEFNCRFGDPETQAIIPLLETDLVEIMMAVVESRLDGLEIRWKPEASATVVAASAGYPGDYVTGKLIEGLDRAAHSEGCTVFHAGTRMENGQTFTDGGRVLAVTGVGADLPQAISRAYAGMKHIEFEGIHYRGDIGHRALR